MPAILQVVGLPNGGLAVMQAAIGNQAFINATLQNTGDVAMTVDMVSVGGAPFSLVGLPALPIVVNPGGSFNFALAFSPVAGPGPFLDTFSVTTSAGVNNSPWSTSLEGIIAPSLTFSPPSPIVFPDTVATHTSAGIVVTLINAGGVDLTVTAIALASGVEFALSLLPMLPLLMHPNDTTTFTVKFHPLAVGPFTDTINVTSTQNSPAIAVQGNGVVLVPIAVVSNLVQKLLFSFLLTAIKFLVPTNLNGALNGTLIFNGPIWDQPSQEKKLRRIWLAYENEGVAALTATVTSFRPSMGADIFDTQTDAISIGTAGADGSERTAYFDIQIAGEVLILSLIRTASTGPVSILGLLPEFEPGAGEKIAGR